VWLGSDGGFASRPARARKSVAAAAAGSGGGISGRAVEGGITIQAHNPFIMHMHDATSK